MAKTNGNEPMPAPQARVQLENPEQVGTISVAEAAEIRERTRLVEAQQKEFDAKQAEIRDTATILTLLRREYTSYLQDLCSARGLDLADGYNVVSETGIIWRVAKAAQTMTEVVPEVVTTEEPVASEA